MGRTCWQMPRKPRFETSGLAAGVDKWYLDELKELSATATVPEFLQKRERLFELRGQGYCRNDEVDGAGQSTRSLLDEWAAVVKRKLKEQQIFEELCNTFFMTLDDLQVGVHHYEKTVESQLPEVNERFSYAHLKNQLFTDCYERQITNDDMKNQLITKDPQQCLILDSGDEHLCSEILEEGLSADFQDNGLCMTAAEDQFSALTSSDSGQNVRTSEDVLSSDIEQTQLSTYKLGEQLEVALERNGYKGSTLENGQVKDDECDKKQELRNLAAGDSNVALGTEEGDRKESEVEKIYAPGIEGQSPSPVTTTTFSLSDRHIESGCINERSILTECDRCTSACSEFHAVTLEDVTVIGYSQDVQLSTVSSDENQSPEQPRSPDSMSFVRDRSTDSLDELLNGSGLRSGCLRDEMDPQSGRGKLPRSFSDLGCFNWSTHVMKSDLVSNLAECHLNEFRAGNENVGDVIEQAVTNYNSIRGDPTTNVQEIFLPKNCLRHFTFSPIASVNTLYRRLAGSCRVFVNRVFCKRRIS
uniref:Uncharacterized protein n=1 Tax=Parascaris univalens TaxID=6257 RepID=A0A914ZMP3_PARUN